MRYLNFTAAIFVLFLITDSFAQYQLEDAFPNLPAFSSPVDFQNSGDCANRIFVVEQAGVIRVFENRADVTETKTFLNITERATSGGETGLLGLAFHPNYESNGYFYVYYTAPNPLRSVVARYQVSSANPDSADKNSEVILLTQGQPFSNHNAGQLAFGPDGYLYIALGDGGSGGDPNGNGQNKSTFLAKILRIDVDHPEGEMSYGIPADNPFKDNTQGYKEEIYAYGFRNPWRYSFDPVTEWLWCADVGQNLYEEIDIVENGKNYGWRCYEGNHAYNTTGCGDMSEYIFPVWEYVHNPECSITGGYVYRGPNQPGLTGKYIYGDYCSNKIWALSYDGVNPATNQLLDTAPSSPFSFGIDEARELYMCGGNGRLYKFMPTAAITAPSSLTAEVTSFFNVKLNWVDNSDNEDGFRIDRMETNGNYSEIAVADANSTSYEDAITIETDYKYRVSAFNSTDTSGYSNEACIAATLLPVELSLFTLDIDKNESSVILKWETASEKNNLGFEVERAIFAPSFDKGDWATVGFVRGNGTATEKSFYQFIDDFGNYGFNGTLRYRLKQVDFDGTFSYSGTVAIDLNILRKDYHLLQNYPNPFNPVTNLRFNIPEESEVKIEIINSLGEVVSQVVNEVRQSGFYNETWNAKDFSSGVYYVRMNAQSLVSDKSYLQTIKMLYLK